MIILYIFERPTYQKGIYAIINIVEKKMYIGLSKNLSIRQRDHMINMIDENKKNRINRDNKKLIEEQNKEFWYFTVDYTCNLENLDKLLQSYESLYMTVVKQNDFELYNTSKNKEIELMRKDLKTLYSESYGDYEDNTAIDDLNREVYIRFDHSLAEIANMSKEERIKCWKDSVKRWENKNRDSKNIKWFLLQGNDENFEIAKSLLARPQIIKSRAKELKIDISEIDIFGSDHNLSPFVILHKFGRYVNESPYQILLRKKLDIKENGFTYWALKRLNASFAEKLSKVFFENQKPSIYAIFITTDSSLKDDKYADWDYCVSEEKVIELDKQIRNSEEYKNKICNYFWNIETRKWEHLNTKTAVTSENSEITYALKISEFYFSKKQFNPREFMSHFSVIPSYHNPNLNRSSDNFVDMRSSAFAELAPDSDYKATRNCESDATDCIIAKLEWPYVVKLAHNIKQK